MLHYLFFFLFKLRKGFIASGLVRTILDSRAPTTPPKQLIDIIKYIKQQSKDTFLQKPPIIFSMCVFLETLKQNLRCLVLLLTLEKKQRQQE